MKDSILRRIEKIMADISGVSLIFIMILTVLSVLGRYVFQVDMIPGVYNIIERILFPLLVFLAIPLTYVEGSFPKLEMVTARFVASKKRVVEIIVLTLEFLVYVLITWYVTIFFLGTIERAQQIQVGVIRWPLSPILAFCFICFVLLTLEFAISIIKKVRNGNLGIKDEVG